MRRTLLSRLPKDAATVSHLALGAHTGSHVDAPVHFLQGSGGIETLDPALFMGSCFVADLRHIPDVIGGDDLEDAVVPPDVPRVIALTKNSGWSRRDAGFRSDYVAFDVTAARWCVQRGVKLLGNDYLSIEEFGTETHVVHTTLLEAGVAILEGVDLDGVSPGVYELSALPVLIPGSDGAPVRAVLVEP